jgi:hypothetical protein
LSLTCCRPGVRLPSTGIVSYILRSIVADLSEFYASVTARKLVLNANIVLKMYGEIGKDRLRKGAIRWEAETAPGIDIVAMGESTEEGHQTGNEENLDTHLARSTMNPLRRRLSHEDKRHVFIAAETRTVHQPLCEFR